MKRLTSIFIFILFTITSLKAQFNNFVQPVKIPIRVAGSFGELRSNHFHSGIDIKTNGRVGLPIHVVENGYISRIKVSPSGFGYALYIKHPNGYTTVYGHLSRFAPKIDQWVKKQQYKKEAFAVDLVPPKTLFKLKRDEVIAYSGNSGSSGGPHLHYEIRETAKQVPLNPATRGLKIKDTRKPLLHRLYVYPLDANSCVNGQNHPVSFPLVPSSKGYGIKDHNKIYVDGHVGVGIEVVDYVSGSWSKCGINHAFLRRENTTKEDTLFAFDIDRFHFYESRYINAHIDYSRKWHTGHKVHRMYRLPGNYLSIYRKKYSNASILIDKNHQRDSFRLGVADSWKNSSYLLFSLTYRDYSKEIKEFQSKDLFLKPIQPLSWGDMKTGNEYKGSSEDMINEHLGHRDNVQLTEELKYNSAHYFHDRWFSFKIDNRTLYQDTKFKGEIINSPIAKWSPIYAFYPDDIALHRSASISFKIGNIPDSLLSKSYVAKLSKDGKHRYYAGGKIEGDLAKFKTRNLGKFTIEVDTIAPKLRSLTLVHKKQRLKNKQGIRFVVKEKETGISHYRGEIDGKYALFTYDSKNRLFEYKVDATRLSKTAVHQLQFTVKDNCGNITEFNGSFVF
ncbi:M23 family metallopeptidase [Halosquirtibacter xylanolyticus]|uniref:M23 family metallopeptidase n=1 Tax=Halosquirtibacter xylanolyticus TaxID=3374599 RepID=UPI00374A8480|nr:M23 family metallopeptidase [Prolixibacteraceae bacterium]